MWAVKYFKNKGLGLTNHFDISIVFVISMFKISKLNRVKKSNIMRACHVSIFKVI